MSVVGACVVSSSTQNNSKSHRLGLGLAGLGGGARNCSTAAGGGGGGALSAAGGGGGGALSAA